MSQFLTALIASATILTIILATDLGRRRVTTMRLVRSILAVVIVIAIFVHSLPHAGNDVSLQLIGVGVGVICGLLAGVLLPAERDAVSGEIYTRGGVAYAVLWIVLSSSRVLFAYGTEHWFPQGIIKFSIDYKIYGAEHTYANAFVFMSLAMVLARTGVLLARRRRLLAPDGGNTVSSNHEERAGTAAR